MNNVDWYFVTWGFICYIVGIWVGRYSYKRIIKKSVKAIRRNYKQ